MFEWLDEEVNRIKTPKFHIIDGPADGALREAIEKVALPLPRAYKEFVLRFGNAKLYRELDYHKLGVLASPREETYEKTGEIFYRFGHYDSSSAYFKGSLLHGEDETPVFEGHERRLAKVADGFEQWLTKRCYEARSKYKKQKWAEIVGGPAPFSLEEQRIVEARRRFTSEAVGVTPAGELLLEVHNGSGIVLPFLSVGIRWKDESLHGGMWLPVSNVLPGQTVVIEHESYKRLAALSEVEVFLCPDPGPEDRDRYWEFKAIVENK